MFPDIRKKTGHSSAKANKELDSDEPPPPTSEQMAAAGRKGTGLELSRLRWILKKKLPTITDEKLHLVM